MAVSHCIHCPNAYCKSHNSAISNHSELGNICNEHIDDFEDILAFYREVGGIDKLVPNPHTALDDVLGKVFDTQPSSEFYCFLCLQNQRRKTFQALMNADSVNPFVRP